MYGPFGDLVKFYFRRHLERVRCGCCGSQTACDTDDISLQAAAEKHGAAGVEGARAKQLANKAKRTEKKQNLQVRRLRLSHCFEDKGSSLSYTMMPSAAGGQDTPGGGAAGARHDARLARVAPAAPAVRRRGRAAC